MVSIDCFTPDRISSVPNPPPINAFPPGVSTRCISRNAAAVSFQKKTDPLLTIRSADASAKGISMTFPVTGIIWSENPAFWIFSVAIGSIASEMSRAYIVHEVSRASSMARCPGPLPISIAVPSVMPHISVIWWATAGLTGVRAVFAMALNRRASSVFIFFDPVF